MASSATVQRPSPNGPTSSTTATKWGAKGTDPGAAFSGLSRAGRGRGGNRGNSRGGRGGGRGRPNTKVSTNPSIEKDALPSVTDTASSAGKSTTSPSTPANIVQNNAENSDKPRTSNNTTNNTRMKAPSRRASRSVPTLVIAPSSATGDAPSTASGRSPNRRKRSSTNSKTPVTPKSANSNNDFLRPIGKPRTAQQVTAPVKDAPPHLSASHDMRTDIDALVERVRAVAMADNRPTTPGSHIDWAGDDDDTLPDLDDWGVTTGTSTENKSEISPIFVDGLRPLPDPDSKSSTGDESQSISPNIAHSDLRVEEAVVPNSTDHSKSEPLKEGESSTTFPSSSPSLRKVEMSSQGSPAKPPLHPSLPPKPIMTLDAPIVSSKAIPSATPMRSSFMVKMPPSTGKISAKPVDPSTIQPVDDQRPTEPAVVKLPEQGLAHSMHAQPPSTDVNLIGDEKLEQGLSASMHAPKGLAESLSAPPSADPILPSFHPTHVRAHTVGRPPSFQHLTSGDPFPQRHSRSGTSSPRADFMSHHSRNHSTPPPGTTHRATRPVISGDAISKLARSLGTSIAPARTTTLTTSKD